MEVHLAVGLLCKRTDSWEDIQMDNYKERLRPHGEVGSVPYHMDLCYSDSYSSPLGLLEGGNHWLGRYGHI